MNFILIFSGFDFSNDHLVLIKEIAPYESYFMTLLKSTTALIASANPFNFKRFYEDGLDKRGDPLKQLLLEVFPPSVRSDGNFLKGIDFIIQNRALRRYASR